MIVFVVCVALILAGAITGYKVTNLAASVGRLVSFSDQIKSDVKAANLPALSDDLEHLDTLTQDLLVAASDPVLSATLDGLPVTGPNLDAVRALAQAAAGLTGAAQPLAKTLPGLEPSALVQNGRYNTATLSALDSGIKKLASQLTISSKQIASIDTHGVNDRLVAAIDSVTPALASAQTLVKQLEPLVAILPIVLESGKDRTWFVALQNLTEARGTGGIFGAYSVLHIDDGALTMTASGSDKDLVPTPVPTDGLPEDFLSNEADNINDWRTINVSPNFPYTGQLVLNEWRKVTGTSVDGVVAFGQGIVQYLLAATGPITIEGTTVDASNVVRFLSLDVYAKYPDATDKNAFVAQLVKEIFTRLQTGKFDIQSLLTSTAGTTTTDRLLAWSPLEAVQNKIVAAGLSGSVPNSYGPTALVTVNNGGGNKLEQFLHVKIDYALGTCSATASKHTRDATMTITLTNDAPTSGLPAYVTPREDYAAAGKPVGSNLEVVSIFLPLGAEDGDTTLDGEDEFGYVGTEFGRNELQFGVDLNPGQTKTLVLPWVEPTVGKDAVDLLSSRASVLTQPSLNPMIVTTPAAASCN